MDQPITAPSLVKGEKVDLTKNNPGLVNINVGLGWDVNANAGGQSYDLDAFLLLCKGGKCTDKNDIIFFNHKKGPGVEHGGDNLTGEGEGDDETIKVNLSAIPAEYDELVIGVNIYQAASKGNQNFGQVKNSFVRLLDASSNVELKRYDLNEDYSAHNAVVMGKIYRKDGEWKFQAIGTGMSGDIFQIADAYVSH